MWFRSDWSNDIICIMYGKEVVYLFVEIGFLVGWMDTTDVSNEHMYDVSNGHF